jgi:phosphotransacetylase
MRPVFEASRHAAAQVVFAEGEDERVLRTAAAILEETDDKPILIGPPRGHRRPLPQARASPSGPTATSSW